MLNSLDSQLSIHSLLSLAQLSTHCLLSFTTRSLCSLWRLDTHSVLFNFSTLTALFPHLHKNSSFIHTQARTCQHAHAHVHARILYTHTYSLSLILSKVTIPIRSYQVHDYILCFAARRLSSDFVIISMPGFSGFLLFFFYNFMFYRPVYKM